jgi:UDPglucose 6-dehydrogenase
MKIGIIGIGRLGLCFALLLEKAGYTVLGSDIRTEYVELLNKKTVVTTEPEVERLLSKSSNLHVTTNNKEVILNTDFIYVMVATPSKSDGSYDTTAVWRTVDDILTCGQDLSGKTLVIGCTVNPGDCLEIQQAIKHLGVEVLYNPEFIAQGSIIRDLQYADMVLIGGENQNTIDKFASVYEKIQVTKPKINSMSLTAAELTKIAINCFLTTKISYANLVGRVLLESNLDQDVEKVLKAIGEDTRIGSKYMKFGFGYGGPCLPRDNRAFGHYAKKLGIEFNLGEVIDGYNKEHSVFLRDYFLEKNVDKLPFYLPSITYKMNTDIIEESQQLKLCIDLLNAGNKVYVENSPVLPHSIKESLLNKYHNLLEFTTSVSLERENIKVFRISV